MKDLTGNTYTALILLLLTVIICVLSGVRFRRMHQKEKIYPSSGLTSQKRLSSYFPELKNTEGDSEVYIFKGEREGGAALILGGTHPNEPAGFVTAVFFIENIQMERGKVVIIPRTNSSGFTHTDPQEGNPQQYAFKTPGGRRWFRFGSRLSNPVHQWPDPSLYINPAGQKLSGAEIRNLNRCYPGRKNGYLTERVAYAVMEVIRKENIDLGIDLHEAAPEYPVINAIVFHENSAELAALAYMELQEKGLEFRLESSPPKLRGLSHREWGDHAHIKTVLLETANVSQGRLKGKTSPSLIIEGKDENYLKAARLSRLFVPYSREGIPLQLRVGRHVAAVKALLSNFNLMEEEKTIVMKSLPSFSQLKSRGVGAFLKPPKKR